MQFQSSEVWIGATDPAEAKEGTIRNLFAESKEEIPCMDRTQMKMHQ